MSASDSTPESDQETNGHGSEVTWFTVKSWSLIAAAVGFGLFLAVGLIRSAVGSTGEAERRLDQFYLSYMVGFHFWLSIPIGCMVLLLIQYLSLGKWGLLMRRIFEAGTRTLPLMIALFIPLVAFLGIDNFSPYWWSGDIGAVAENATAKEELTEKANDFLNERMFMTVGVVFFVIWGVIIYLLNHWSHKADEQEDAPERFYLKAMSGPSLMLHAVTVTIAATIWIMSLELSWNSTMFPVIYGVNQLLTAYAFSLGLLLTMVRNPQLGTDNDGNNLANRVKPLHQIDMGSFLLAFTLFWTYISFSQFLLVWVANLPEEIPFYLKRIRGGWEYVAIILAIFHFALPFMLLLFRHVKYNQKALRTVAWGLVAMCAFDVVWWIEPSVSHEGQPLYWLMDVGAIVGIGGLWLWYFVGCLESRPLLPTFEKLRLDEEDHHDH